jgi:opacity protein-like surface antigen
MVKRSVVPWLLAAVLALAGAPALAVDGVSIEYGHDSVADMGRVGIQWDWKKRWFEGSSWHVGGYWDLALGYWRRDDVLVGQNDEITEIGLTPVFRLQGNQLKGPYAEVGIGFHLLSKTSLGDKQFSTAFQFGEHLGVGYRFGAKGAFDVSYRYQHLSNADIKRPNSGINFNQIRVQYHF